MKANMRLQLYIVNWAVSTDRKTENEFDGH